MTFFDLMRRNAWRKRLRSVLLMFSVGIAFLIYGLTASFVSGSQGRQAPATICSAFSTNRAGDCRCPSPI